MGALHRASPAISVIQMTPAAPDWLLHLRRAAIAGVCLLLGFGVGIPTAALAAGDKPDGAAAKDEAMDSDNADADNDAGEDTTPGFRLERVREIVLWNEHNGQHHDSGADKCTLTLLLGGKTVWEHKDVEVPWDRNKS
ncbi:MAG TPA: hypothetical protein VGG30_08665, partial [Pirellulales bacterium]